MNLCFVRFHGSLEYCTVHEGCFLANGEPVTVTVCSLCFFNHMRVPPPQGAPPFSQWVHRSYWRCCYVQRWCWDCTVSVWISLVPEQLKKHEDGLVISHYQMFDFILLRREMIVRVFDGSWKMWFLWFLWSFSLASVVPGDFFSTILSKSNFFVLSISHYGSMGLVYLPTWLVEFYGFHVGIYTIHGSYGYGSLLYDDFFWPCWSCEFQDFHQRQKVRRFTCRRNLAKFLHDSLPNFIQLRYHPGRRNHVKPTVVS